MSKNVTQYDLLVSCPGDVSNELKIIEDIVNQFNDSYSDVLQVSLRIRHWAKSAYSESGGKPQDLLNKQFVNECDAAIAIFWTRFGTPTDTYGSGTEEEIQIMLEAGKQVFLYFSDIPASPSSVDKEQYEKINEFKERYKDKGLYFTYNAYEDFQKLFSAHLTKYFLSLEAVKEITSTKKPVLCLKSINSNQQIEENATPVLFEIPIHQSVADMLVDIKNLFQKINDSPRLPVSAFDTIGSTFQEAVKINDEKKDFIVEFAKILKIEMAENFFSLGGLKKDMLGNIGGIGIGFSPKFNGTSEEIEKRNDILELYEKIVEVFNWKGFEDTFSKLRCIKLCVENSGTTFDEDIEIALRIPKEMVMLPKDIPFAEDFDISDTEFSYSELFGISATANYLDFDESIKTPAPPYSPPSLPIGMLYGSGKSIEEEYYDTLYEDVFIYDYFDENDYIVMKLKFDYIKHNTVVAFPTVLFVTDKISDIEYSISSKHCDTLTTGTLKVETDATKIINPNFQTGGN